MKSVQDISEKLRSYKRDRSGYAEYCHRGADKIDQLRNDVTILRYAVAKAASHVKPTCGDLYNDLMKILASTERYDRS